MFVINFMHKATNIKKHRTNEYRSQKICTLYHVAIDDDIWVCVDDQVNYKVHFAEWNWIDLNWTGLNEIT